MNKGLGVVIWQIAVAVFLIAIGIMGINGEGDLDAFGGGDVGKILRIVASVIALIAGAGLVLELFGAQMSFLGSLILIIAIVWIVFIVIMIINGFRAGFSLALLRELAVYTMVLGSLLGASGKFGS